MGTTSKPSERPALLKIENIVLEGDQILLTGTFKIPRGRIEEVLVLLVAPAAPVPQTPNTVEELVRRKFQALMPGSDWAGAQVRESASMLLTAPPVVDPEDVCPQRHASFLPLRRIPGICAPTAAVEVNSAASSTPGPRRWR